MTTGTPWLSVLIPVYNVAPYLRQCLESVLTQADAGVEVLLVDDCSTDGSGALMQELAGGRAQVRCLRHERNSGLSAARNTLLAQARGDYVWFLDSDDFLEPGAIAGLRAIVAGQAPDLVLCDFRMLREPMRLKHRLRGELHMHTFRGPARTLLRDRSQLLRGLFESGQMHSWSKIARRSLWGEDLRFPVGRYFEDMATTPFLALRARSYWYEPAVWVAYRQRAGSILRSPDIRKATDMAEALLGLPEACAGQALDPAARFAWAHFAARNFIAAARLASGILRGEAPAQIRRYRDGLARSAPLTAAELLTQYLRRGWWWRGLRLRYWLRRAQPELRP